jgi:prepilin-type N-terminal cleavage/methylation domain-containing protein
MLDRRSDQISRRVRSRDSIGGFTLIEVLVVVAIIALLLSILLPSLKAAREQARWTTCLANMSNLPKAVMMFAQSHKERAQLMLQSGENGEVQLADPAGSMYAYQSDVSGVTNPDPPRQWLKHWTVAYGRELGIGTMKRTENYTEATAPDGSYNPDPDYYFRKYSRLNVLVCPSDTGAVRMTVSHGPSGQVARHGVISYGGNADIFGVSPYRCQAGWSNPLVWNDGQLTDRLQGRLAKIIRPSEVALFADGGNEWRPGENADFFSDSSGPYIEHAEYIYTRLPHQRHGKGGLTVALADGSGLRLKALNWVNNVRMYSQFDHKYIVTDFVKDYSARIRVTPFNAGTPPPITSGY